MRLFGHNEAVLFVLEGGVIVQLVPVTNHEIPISGVVFADVALQEVLVALDCEPCLILTVIVRCDVSGQLVPVSRDEEAGSFDRVRVGPGQDLPDDIAEKLVLVGLDQQRRHSSFW